MAAQTRWNHQSILPTILIPVLAACKPGPLSAAGLDDLVRPMQGRSRRVSSHDLEWQNGNRDWRAIEADSTLTLAELNGPGTIRHLWFTLDAQDPYYPRSLVLRMYWDGAGEPAVEAPLGDFFAVGHGLRRLVDSEPVTVISEGRAYTCFWAMPFRKSARITLTNESPKARVPKLYYYIDYDALDTLPDDVLYFHAQYRQEYPARPGDYLVCQIEGQGHYAGTVLSVQLRTDGWFGEGDDRFTIDGEDRPSIHGTGTEDYFNDAWGLRELMRPCFGAVLAEGFQFGDRTTAYRWHVRDPVRFRKSLRFVIEHKGQMLDRNGKTVSGHAERADLFSSVAFWYQAGQARRFTQLPPAAERVLPARSVEIEAFNDQARVTAGRADIAGNKSPVFSRGAQLLVSGAKEGTIVSVPFVLDEPLAGAGRLVLNRCVSAGIWRAHLDGRLIERMRFTDLYSLPYGPAEFNLGYVELDAGPHELKFECLGKRAEARDSQLGIDAIRVESVTRYHAE